MSAKFHFWPCSSMPTSQRHSLLDCSHALEPASVCLCGEHTSSTHAENACWSSSLATTIQIDESDNDGDCIMDIGDDNDNAARYDIRFECSSQVDAVEFDSSRGGCDVKSKKSAASSSDDDADAIAVTRVFARKRGRQDHGAASNSCDRCKSNLNGKLVVHCALCSFRRHLYCFTPPLKQHPAVLEQLYITAQGTKVRVYPTSETIASWTCKACRQHGHACEQLQRDPEAKLRNHVGRSRSPRKRRVWRERVASRIQQPQTSRLDEQTALHAAGAAAVCAEVEANCELSPVQAQWRRDGTSRFDWIEFRAEKTKRVVAEVASEGAATGGLVYYSKPFADMKKTALNWMRRVAHQKRAERSRDQRETKKRLPPKRSVMYHLTESELEKLNLTLMTRQRDANDERRLFDDSLTYEFDMSLSRIRRLREARASEIDRAPDVADDLEVAVTAVITEVVETVCLSIEDVEAVCLSLEDVEAVCLSLEDVGAPASAAIAAPRDTGRAIWAAVVIKSAIIQAAFKAKQRTRVRQRRLAVAEALTQRRDAAAASMRVLCLCVQFILVVVRGMRNAQTKKLLLQSLQEASEDAKVVDSTEGDAERTRKLAEKRIQRFFLQRVRRYLHLKKKVMSRRIGFWWKRRRAWWRWRETARTLRDRWLNSASSVIQSAQGAASVLADSSSGQEGEGSVGDTRARDIGWSDCRSEPLRVAPRNYRQGAACFGIGALQRRGLLERGGRPRARVEAQQLHRGMGNTACARVLAPHGVVHVVRQPQSHPSVRDILHRAGRLLSASRQERHVRGRSVHTSGYCDRDDAAGELRRLAPTSRASHPVLRAQQRLFLVASARCGATSAARGVGTKRRVPHVPAGYSPQPVSRA
ncbi:hypothetical protein PybrP1_006590 [[Pythium] brassicae (nom. inval.)]|nr:hypothetical protein PybrP1_006590 [[Pythium] brassicae (nom. inval.)]